MLESQQPLLICQGRRNPLATRPWSRLSIFINPSELKSLTSCAVNAVLLALGSTPGHHPEYLNFLTAVSCSRTKSRCPHNKEEWRCLAHSLSIRTYGELYLRDTFSDSSSHSLRIFTSLPQHLNIMFNYPLQSICLPKNCKFTFYSSWPPQCYCTSETQNSTISLGKRSSWIITVIKFFTGRNDLLPIYPLFMISKASIVLPHHTIQLSLLQIEGL